MKIKIIKIMPFLALGLTGVNSASAFPAYPKIFEVLVNIGEKKPVRVETFSGFGEAQCLKNYEAIPVTNNPQILVGEESYFIKSWFCLPAYSPGKYDGFLIQARSVNFNLPISLQISEREISVIVNAAHLPARLIAD